jgi:hypothetical protein
MRPPAAPAPAEGPTLHVPSTNVRTCRESRPSHHGVSVGVTEDFRSGHIAACMFIGSDVPWSRPMARNNRSRRTQRAPCGGHPAFGHRDPHDDHDGSAEENAGAGWRSRLRRAGRSPPGMPRPRAGRWRPRLQQGSSRSCGARRRASTARPRPPGRDRCGAAFGHRDLQRTCEMGWWRTHDVAQGRSGSALARHTAAAHRPRYPAASPASPPREPAPQPRHRARTRARAASTAEPPHRVRVRR